MAARGIFSSTLLALAVTVMALAGCSAGGSHGAGGGSPQTPSSAASQFAVLQRAESGPILALAFHAPHLWVGTARGLRRLHVDKGTYDWVDEDSGLLGRRVSALAVDQTGAAWVATEAGVGRITVTGEDDFHYEPLAPVAGVAALVPLPGSAGGAWAGGAHGLFRLDGRSWRPVASLREVPVSTLDLDPDGRAVWVGTRHAGLFRVAGQQATPVRWSGGEGDGASDEIVSAARIPQGPLLLAVRSTAGARVVFVPTDTGDAEVFRPHPEVPIAAVIVGGGQRGPTVIAGLPGAERVYALRELAPAESPPKGGFRLISTAMGGRRYSADPMPLRLPPDVSVALAGGDSLWLGTQARGVARAAADGPQFLGSGELVGDAERIRVACAAPERCYVLAGGDHAWITDGRAFRETRLGETDAGRVLGVAVDRTGTLTGVVAEPGFGGLILTRPVGSGATTATGADPWRPAKRLSLDLADGVPEVAVASLSPDDVWWLGVRVRDAAGAAVGFRVICLALPSLEQNQPTFGKSGRIPALEQRVLPNDVNGLLVDGSSIWWSSGSGLGRWQVGQPRPQKWGEDTGLESEAAHVVALGPDGQVWAGTSAGVVRFDGRRWRSVGSEAKVSVFGLTRDGQLRLWMATAKGLRVIDSAEVGRGESGTMIVTDAMRDVTIDRYGRVWGLGGNAITFVDPSRTALKSQPN